MTLTLLTDFGVDDIFVGVMKGVIRGIAPAVAIVDLTHAVPPQDIRTGAFYLQMAWRWFPPGSVHVVVVDPGVGTSRRAIAVEAHGHYFVAPDNGILAPVLEAGPWRAVSIENPQLRLPSVSQTFHGRDIFAPAGAHLAAGVPLDALGPPVDELVPGPLARPHREEDAWIGHIAWIDHFGNLVSTLTAELLTADAQPIIRLGELEIAGLRSSYAEAEPGMPVALINSFGYLEIAVNRGHAARQIGAALGTPLRLSFR